MITAFIRPIDGSPQVANRFSPSLDYPPEGQLPFFLYTYLLCTYVVLINLFDMRRQNLKFIDPLSIQHNVLLR